MARATARPGGINPPCTDREPDNFAVATALSTIVSGLSISVMLLLCTNEIGCDTSSSSRAPMRKPNAVLLFLGPMICARAPAGI